MQSWVMQTNPVYRIANLPSFFMRLTGICDYPFQANIHKFTALLLSTCLLPDTVGLL